MLRGGAGVKQAGPHTVKQKCFAYLLRVLLQVDLLLGISAQQVSDLLVVDLQVGTAHKELLVCCDLDVLKDVIEGVWDDTAQLSRLLMGGASSVAVSWCLSLSLSLTVLSPVTDLFAFHGERLSTPSLSISKHGAIVALEDRLYQRISRLFIETHLCGEEGQHETVVGSAGQRGARTVTLTCVESMPYVESKVNVLGSLSGACDV